MATPPISNGQIVPNGQQPYSNQQNFGQMIGEISSWTSHVPIPMIQNIINNAVRAYYDRRLWYGLMTKGQIVSPGYFSTGTVAVTQGSNIVTGINTNWTQTLGGQPIIGQQLRTGFTSPIYTIVGADLLTSPQTITLELPWGNQSQSSTGYYIAKYFYSIPNIKFFYSVKNLQMQFRMWCNVPETLLESWDPSRLQMVYPRVLATTVPDSSGAYQFELWPVPNYPAAFPYLAYITPPNLVDDLDNLPPYMRCDVIKAKALSEALLYRPKQNPNYGESTCITISQQKLKEYEIEAERAAQSDENAFRQDVLSQWECFPMANMDFQTGNLAGGAYSAAMSPVSLYDFDY